MLQYKDYINGEFVDADNGATIKKINPATGEQIGIAPKCGRAETKRAIDAAYKAEDAWKNVPAHTRGQYDHKMADILRNNADRYTKMLMMEQGKVYAEAHGEILFSADYFDYMGAAARHITGSIMESDNANENIFIQKKPVGVVGGVLPWNYPVFLLARKIGPAMVAGDTIVVKLSTDTPLLGLDFAKQVSKLGLPKGVINFVTGPGSVVGDELSSNPRVHLVSLTGSTRAGISVATNCAKHMGRVSLELGGKAPTIVCSDANLPLAVKSVIQSRFDNNGQLCNNTERVYVQKSVAKKFTKMLVAGVKKMKTDDTLADKNADMGPLINKKALDNVAGMVKRAKAAGAKVECGGKVLNIKKGFFYAPTVITNVKQDSELVQDEIFGPVVPIVVFDTLDDAIKMANDNQAGLTSAIFTQNVDKAMWATNQLDDGETYINRMSMEGINGYHNGHKMSGIGGDDGMKGLNEFLEEHVTYLRMHPSKDLK